MFVVLQRVLISPMNTKHSSLKEYRFHLISRFPGFWKTLCLIRTSNIKIRLMICHLPIPQFYWSYSRLPCRFQLYIATTRLSFWNVFVKKNANIFVIFPFLCRQCPDTRQNAWTYRMDCWKWSSVLMVIMTFSPLSHIATKDICKNKKPKQETKNNKETMFRLETSVRIPNGYNFDSTI